MEYHREKEMEGEKKGIIVIVGLYGKITMEYL